MKTRVSKSKAICSSIRDTHPSSITGFVICAKDGEHVSAAHSNLLNEGHQIVRIPQRILPNVTAWMRAYWIEISQEYNLPLWIRMMLITQNVFVHKL